MRVNARFSYTRRMNSAASWTSIVLVTGCASLVASLQPPPPEPVVVTYRLPAITPTAGASQQSLTRGGIAITVTPAVYVADSMMSTEEVETGRGVTCTRAKAGGADVMPVRFLTRTRRPSWRVRPANLEFLVKITNQMPRVLRGAGTIVQFIVAGHLVSVPQSEYSEFANAIVPPRNEAEIHVAGPPLSTIPDGATIGLFLYDVPTNMDAAGNVTRKQNYEWYYTYRTAEVAKRIFVETSRSQESGGETVRRALCQ